MSGSLFLWGLLGLLQIAFLPGHLLTRALRLRPGVVDALLLSFGLSTLVNYLLIQVLVFFHIFTRPVVLGVIVVEVLFTLLLWCRATSHDRWQRSIEAYQDAMSAWSKLLSTERAVVIAVALLGVYCTVSFAHFATAAWQDEAFTLWDNVMSWNRWATDWFANKFPGKTYHYPQLLPANSSIIYVLAGTTAVQAFNRLFFAFFPIALFICLLDLGLRRREIGFWLGIPFIYFAWIFMARPFPAEGYADVPVTFMMLMAFYSMLVADEQRDAGCMFRWMLTAGLFTGAALVTKQTGFVILLTLPALLALLINSRNLLSPVQKRDGILWAFTLAFSVSVPWYIVKEFQIRAGGDQSEIAASVVAHAGRGLIERMQYGLQQMFVAWGTVQTVTVAALAAAAAFLRTPWRWIVLLIVLPGFFVWAFTTSYDLRNSNFVVVLGCVSAGVTLGQLLARGSAAWGTWPVALRCVATVVCAAILAVVLSFLPSVSNSILISRSNQAQRTTAMPELNAEIYRLIAEGKISRPVITNYWMMYFIPGLKEYMTYDSLTDTGSFKEIMARSNPEYIVILHPSQNYPAVSDQIVADHVAKGLWSVAKTGDSFQILQIHPAPILQSEHNPIPQPELSLPRFGVYKVLSGLASEEGPYLQSNLPVVRWGLGPVTKLEFEAKPNESYELTFDVERSTAKLTLGIVLNGALTAHAEIAADLRIKNFKFPLDARSGTNQLEIRYSAWDAHSESRPLALLYSAIQILPKKL